jgi:prepilin-type N-terminal cleavage/methylation domain-containing protein
MHRGKRERGFTLTEVLMAVGILGIGLTMVASIFPVAVDQSRISRDQTYAALCARSAAALLRIRHNKMLTDMRSNVSDATWRLTKRSYIFPDSVLVYAPSWFLYRDSSPRSYDGVSRWGPGHYTYQLFTGRTTPSSPHRVVIAVCRTSGETPLASLDALAQAYWNNVTPAQLSRPGAYALNASGGLTMGYQVAYVKADKTAYLSVGLPYTGTGAIPDLTNEYAWWYLQDVVEVFHTYVGE